MMISGLLVGVPNTVVVSYLVICVRRIALADDEANIGYNEWDEVGKHGLDQNGRGESLLKCNVELIDAEEDRADDDGRDEVPIQLG